MKTICESPISTLISIAKQLESKELSDVQNDLVECAVHILTNVMFQVSGTIAVAVQKPHVFKPGEPCEVRLPGRDHLGDEYWQRTTVIDAQHDQLTQKSAYQTAITGRNNWISQDRLREVPKS